ncbi:hypothetical protein MRX96_039947 [Rhipicephalus microplus]
MLLRSSVSTFQSQALGSLCNQRRLLSLPSSTLIRPAYVLRMQAHLAANAAKVGQGSHRIPRAEMQESALGSAFPPSVGPGLMSMPETQEESRPPHLNIASQPATSPSQRASLRLGRPPFRSLLRPSPNTTLGRIHQLEW